MFLSIKQLSDREKDICSRTLSPKAIFAIIGDALSRGEGLSVVRMGDGEARLLGAPDGQEFMAFGKEWNERLGIAGLEIEKIKDAILEAGNTATYFAPSVSGISLSKYSLHDFFNKRDLYFDNFFVNDWTKAMIQMLLESADGAFVIHKEPDVLIDNFTKTYNIPTSKFSSFVKTSWRDNEQAVQAASISNKRLVLFSAGPAGKVIGPAIAKTGKIVLDLGNTLPGWSIGNNK